MVVFLRCVDSHYISQNVSQFFLQGLGLLHFIKLEGFLTVHLLGLLFININ